MDKPAPPVITPVRHQHASIKISWEPTPCTHPGTISVAVVAVATGSDGHHYAIRIGSTALPCAACGLPHDHTARP